MSRYPQNNRLSVNAAAIPKERRVNENSLARGQDAISKMVMPEHVQLRLNALDSRPEFRVPGVINTTWSAVQYPLWALVRDQHVRVRRNPGEKASPIGWIPHPERSAGQRRYW